MPLLSWSDKFAIGLPLIDEQHRRLFDLTNNLYDCVQTDSSKGAVSDAIAALIDYTQYHFKAEEDYMFNVEYTRFEQHKLAHDNLTQQALDFKAKFQKEEGDTGEFIKFLFDWLTKHIMDQDKKIGKFMEMKLLKPIL